MFKLFDLFNDGADQNYFLDYNIYNQTSFSAWYVNCNELKSYCLLGGKFSSAERGR